MVKDPELACLRHSNGSKGRARQNRTAALPTPRACTAAILWPGFAMSYFNLAAAFMHLVQAFMRSPKGSPHFIESS